MDGPIFPCPIFPWLTALLALALKDATCEQKAELKQLLTGDGVPQSQTQRIERLREIFQACEVFDKAEVLVERTREKAESLLQDIEDHSVRDLLRFFVETILARELPPTMLEENPGILVQLNTVTNGSASLLPIIGG